MLTRIADASDEWLQDWDKTLTGLDLVVDGSNCRPQIAQHDWDKQGRRSFMIDRWGYLKKFAAHHQDTTSPRSEMNRVVMGTVPIAVPQSSLVAAM